MSASVVWSVSKPDFITLKSELFKQSDGSVLYEDPNFPTKYSMLFNRTNPEFPSSDIIWRRPGQLSKNPCLLKSFDAEESTRFYQGKLTPFWFPILVSILKEKNMLEKVMPSLSNQNTFNQDYSLVSTVSTSYCGAFEFHFHRGMVLEAVIIDDRLPTNISCNLLSAMTSEPDEFLPALLEKAYAKLLGGYFKLHNETLFSAIMDFTGGLVESISRTVDDMLSSSEVEEFYSKIKSIIGESFVMFQIDEHHDKELMDNPYQMFLVTGHTEIPPNPPDGLVDDLFNSLDDTRGQLVPAVRVYPLLDIPERNVIDKHILFKWENSSFLVKMKYGLETNTSNEIWMTVEDLLNLSRKMIILHFFHQSSIAALAKIQSFWKYTFFESFWHRDDPRGNVDSIGDAFLRNKQYLFVVDDDEGCCAKICLTNMQKYNDVEPNVIQSARDTEIGLTIFEVEKNRMYRIHDLEHTYEVKYYTDYRMGRYLVISAFLDRGSYIVVPWISRGGTTKYTLQVFSSSMDSEIRVVDLDIPKHDLCIACQIKQTAIYSQNKLRSIYDRTNSSDRKTPNAEVDSCLDCRSLYPKRATRISVIGAQNISLTPLFHVPNFYFKIVCEKESYTSRYINSTLSPQWNEHFIFYRMDSENSDASIELFCDNKLGLWSRIFEHTFTKLELMSNDTLFLPLDGGADPESRPPEDNKLVVVFKNYFVSEFGLA